MSVALETDLDENAQVLQVAATPIVKGLQQLEAVALGADVHFEAAAVRGGVLVSVLARVKVSEGQFVSRWRLQLELLAIGCRQVICLWIEVQGASDGQGSDDLDNREEEEQKKKQWRFLFLFFLHGELYVQ